MLSNGQLRPGTASILCRGPFKMFVQTLLGKEAWEIAQLRIRSEMCKLEAAGRQYAARLHALRLPAGSAFPGQQAACHALLSLDWYESPTHGPGQPLAGQLSEGRRLTSSLQAPKPCVLLLHHCCS